MLPDPLTIERAGLKAWPGIEVEWDGQWVRRASNGYTKRANSVQCFDPADDTDVADRVAAARRWFERRGLPPVFRTNLLSAPALVAELDRQGWAHIEPSLLMAMPLASVEADAHGRAVQLDDPAFLAAQQRLWGYDDQKLERLRALVAQYEVPATGIVLDAPDGRPVATALLAIADGIAIAGNVVTAAAERRKGHAAALMRTGLAWAKAAGARVAALNVVAGNAPALALYESLGYRRQYDYVYRVPPA